MGHVTDAGYVVESTALAQPPPTSRTSPASSSAGFSWPRQLAVDRKGRQRCASRARSAFFEKLRQLDIPADVGHLYEVLYVPLALWIDSRCHTDRPLIVGINGAQGAGKTTLQELLGVVLQIGLSRQVASLSIDDLYLTRAERQRLAEKVHPLLATRGVPGTHDVGLGTRVLDRLCAATAESRTPLPSFDKSTDDRRPSSAWRVHAGRPDIIVFEGWCVGARPQPPTALVAAINELERVNDPAGHWRCYVNDRLAGEYRPLFERLDLLLMLKVPGMHKVFEWRALQERKLIAEVGRTAATLSPAELRTFIMHYERLTLHTLEEMPARADLCMEIDDSHQICAVGCPD